VAAQNLASFSGGINGTGGVKLNDAGKLTLSDGTYSGTTVVEKGKLEITGTLSRSEVTVDKSGILAGTGYLGGHAVIANNATLSPGSESALGSLNFMAGLTLNGNLRVTVAPGLSPNSDRVNVSGALEAALENTGAVTLTNIGTPYAAGQLFQIFNQPLPNSGSRTIQPPTPAPGLLWENRLALDGSIAVISDPNTISFAQWAQDMSGLFGPDAAFDADPNKDGMANGLAFSLGAPNALYDAGDLLPEWSYIPAHIEDGNQYPGEIVISYPSSQQAAISVSSALEYSTDLVNWAAATEDDTHITINIEENFYGEGIDRVEVHLLDALAPGGKFILRLRASPKKAAVE
jgi:hypothetical protein